MSVTDRALAASTSVRGAAGNAVQSCPKVTLEIGVFFDGTGNNTANVEVGRGSGSYANARSNVSLLYPLYKQGERFTIKNDCGGAARKFGSIYMEGIGTTAGETDKLPRNMSGAALGMGPTGIEARVFDACVKVGFMITDLSKGVEPELIILDVFGFSRGAAAARYFVNCMRQGYIDYYVNYVSLKRAILPKGRTIEIRYVGIFDTVAAVGLGTNDDNGPVNVHVASRQAKRIHHLTAKHEYRENFRLNDNLPGGGSKRIMLGAHSDIGGGYRDMGDKAVVQKVSQIKRGLLKDAQAEHRIATIKAARERNAATSFWVSEGWIRPNEADGTGLVNKPSDIIRRGSIGAMGGGMMLYTFQTGAALIRPWVKVGLSTISMKVMHADAVKSSVPFLAYPTSGSYQVPPGLVSIASDYANGGATPTGAVAREVLRNYGHMSSNYDSTGMSPDEGFVRGVAPNRPGEAK